MKKIISNLLISVSLASMSMPVFASQMNSFSPVIASTEVDESNVLEDLLTVPEFKTAYLDNEYIADSTLDDFDVLYLVESGFENNHQNYDLVLYVWNKSGNGFETYNFKNNYNSVEFYSFVTYKSFSVKLNYINRSPDNQFIKYRVHNVNYEDFLNSESGRREYGVKGIEIAHYDNHLQKVKEYPIAKKWNYVGEGDDLLVTHNSSFDYLQIDIGSGAFGFNKYSITHSYPGWTELVQDNLYYVYFNIPKIYQNSTSLYSIHADYYDFDFSEKIAFLLDENSQDYYYENYDSFINLFSSGYDLYDDELSGNIDNFIFHAIFDKYAGARKVSSYVGDDANYLPRFQYKAYIAGFTQNGPFDSIAVGQNYERLTSEQFCDRFKYLIPISDLESDVSGHLISSYFDRERAEEVSGQSSADVYKDIHMCNISRDDSDAIETHWDLVSEVNRQNWFWTLFHDYYDSYDIHGLNCIEHVDVDDFNLSDSDFKNKYYVSEEDAASIKDLISSNDDTYLFRFKIDQSGSTNLVYAYGQDNVWHTWEDIGFAGTRYHAVVDFDVLDMTFINEDNTLESMPIVADPVNVFPDIPSPFISRVSASCGGLSSKSFWWILMIAALILIILLVIKYIVPAIATLRLTNETRKARKIEQQKLNKQQPQTIVIERKGGSKRHSKKNKYKYKKIKNKRR